jgi:hypothetical protein
MFGGKNASIFRIEVKANGRSSVMAGGKAEQDSFFAYFSTVKFEVRYSFEISKDHRQFYPRRQNSS